MTHADQRFIGWAKTDRNTASDNMHTALTKLQAAARMAAGGQSQNTLYDLRRILCIAATPTAKRWVVKVDQVIAHVLAGHCAGCDDDLRKLWNKRNYEGAREDGKIGDLKL